MNLPPLPTSANAGLPENQAPAAPSSDKVDPQSPGKTDVLKVLRDALADGSCPPEAIFHAIADAARVLTGASGTAIALRSSGAVVCRARSGDIAPEIGSALNVESGISGESFRTSAVLCCHDAESDSRVEADVCRALGICSIVVVPLRDAAETVGILEAFSGEAGAFGGEQIGVLKNLGEIAETAYQRRAGLARSVPVGLQRMPPGPGVPVAATIRSEPISLPVFAAPAPRARHHYWILSGALAMLLLASGVVWWTWHEPAGEPTGQAVTQAHAAPAESTVPAAASSTPGKSSAGVVNPSRSATNGVLRNAAKVESTEDADVVRHARNAAGSITLPAASGGGSRPTAETDSVASVEPPTVVMGSMSGNNSEKLANLASAEAALPTLEVRVSQGVTEPSIIRKVEPAYPREALLQHLGGTVSLTASIGDDGTVREVKVLQGDATLGAAAVAAVRQWRYSPCLLNGKPIAVQRTITIVFKAP
jgi:TonB family protein